MKKKQKFGSKLPNIPPRSCGTVIPQRDFHPRIQEIPLFIEVSAQFCSRMCAHGHARSYTRVICPKLDRLAVRNTATLLVAHPSKTNPFKAK